MKRKGAIRVRQGLGVCVATLDYSRRMWGCSQRKKTTYLLRPYGVIEGTLIDGFHAPGGVFSALIYLSGSLSDVVIKWNQAELVISPLFSEQ